jgi:predicted small secreted protein
MKQLTTVIAVLCLLALGGCNTVRGIGQDIGQAGSAIEKAAK